MIVGWNKESNEVLECLANHSWFAHRPRVLREDVPMRAKALADRQDKRVYGQHVLQAAAEIMDETNTAAWFRRYGTAS